MSVTPIKMLLDPTSAEKVIEDLIDMLVLCEMPHLAQDYCLLLKKYREAGSLRKKISVWREIKKPFSYGYGGPFDWLPYSDDKELQEDMLAKFFAAKKNLFRYF